MNIQEIMIRKFNKVVVPIKGGETPIETIGQFMVNINDLGYTIDSELMISLTKLDKEEVIKFCNEVVDGLKELIGASEPYRPMYPNFPEQVADASSLRLYWDAMLHGAGLFIGKNILPKTATKDR
jgi:hypothetical protein